MRQTSRRPQIGVIFPTVLLFVTRLRKRKRGNHDTAMAASGRFELPTPGLGNRCSIP